MRVEFFRPSFPPILSYIPDLFKIYKSGIFTNNGPYVRKLESRLKDYIGCRNRPLLVNNATTGLMVAIMALQLPKGSKVIVPSFTFSATVQAILMCGLEPVYCDIDPNTFNIEPHKVEDILLREKGISAIIVVNCFGNPSDVRDFEILRNHYKVKLIFDSAGAIGSTANGTRLGNFGDAEVFSLHATKLLPVGEGGFICFRDEEALALARKIIAFGFGTGRSSEVLGFNGKLSEISAAIGLRSLDKLQKSIIKRNKLSAFYDELFSKFGGNKIKPQKISGLNFSSRQIYSIVCETPEIKRSLSYWLWQNGIQTMEYFNPPCHKQPALARECELPATDFVCERIVSMPIWDDMTDKHLKYIKSVVQNWDYL